MFFNKNTFLKVINSNLFAGVVGGLGAWFFPKLLCLLHIEISNPNAVIGAALTTSIFVAIRMKVNPPGQKEKSKD